MPRTDSVQFLVLRQKAQEIAELPIAPAGGFDCAIVRSISFSISQDRDAKGHEHGRNNQDENACAKPLDETVTRTGSLRIAERAALGVRGGVRTPAREHPSLRASHDGATFVIKNIMPCPGERQFPPPD